MTLVDVRIGFNVVDGTDRHAPDHEPRQLRVILEVSLWGHPQVGDEINVDGWGFTVHRRSWDSDGLYVWAGQVRTTQMRAWDGAGTAPTVEEVAAQLKADAAAEMLQVRRAG